MAANRVGAIEDPITGWHIAVVIPARDEEHLLPSCLHSVARARAALPANITSDVIIVSDGSIDGTVRLARSILGSQGAVFHTQAGNVGAARAFAADRALSRYTGPIERCWLANTDADCQVPESWLVEHLRMACLGHTAVAGTIDVHDFSEHLPIVEERFRQTYIIEANGSHSHIHGANLGVRADAYLRAGGWSALDTAEDHDLWKRLHMGNRVHASNAQLRVLTSGRRIGRAPRGFADALALHNLSIA